MSDGENHEALTERNPKLRSSTTIHNWNRTRDCLNAIDSHANWISHYCVSIKKHAGQIEYAINLLSDRPDWETKAQDELKQSIETLQLTLALCRSALEAYELKPVIIKHETEAAE